MSLFSLVLLSLGLSMDAFAVSLSCGIYAGKERFNAALKSGLYFGVFQGIMPVIGFFIGRAFDSIIKSFDHWIAFLILFLIGAKMIFESFKKDDCKKRIDTGSFRVMIILAIATSIDALACGVSIALLNSGIFIPALVIGSITFLISFLGVYLGDRIGNIFRKGAEILGGSVLMFIGLKILIEHIF